VIEFVSATRMTRDEFWKTSALGRSLLRIDASDHERWVAKVAFENRRGLSEVFNERVRDSDHDTLVFIHDDVWIDDCFICDHLEEALHEFDVVGVAGNSRRVPNQPAWAFTHISATEFVWDEREKHLRGATCHGKDPLGFVNRFGPTYAECELLDGVFMAARRATLLERGVAFDARFKFDFYDVDFCRSARAAGLKLGCWPIAITHQSMGVFGSESWRAGYAAYLEKWKD
jgi:GT2 family glycosyltransferase